MPNTNNQTIHQFGAGISQMVRQATGRDSVESIGMDWVTVEQTSKYEEYEKSGDVVSFYCTIDDPMEVTAEINPVQDLHGYDYPWPAGGGKNLCPPIQNATFQQVTTSTDSMGKTTVTGTATGDGGRLNLCSVPFTLPAGSYTISHNGTGTWGYTLSLSEDGGSQLYECRSTSTYSTFTLSESKTVVVGITIESGVQYNGTVSPQIEVGSQKTSYAPYSNLCPISGWTGANVSRTGKNLLNIHGSYINRSAVSGTYTIGEDSITVQSKTTGAAYCGFVFPVKVGEQYTISHESGELVSVKVAQLDEIPTDINSEEKYGTDKLSGATITATKPYIMINFVANNTAREYKKPQFVVGTSVSGYAPYVEGETIEYEFPAGAGTVYGGTLTVNKDGTGTLVVDKANIESYNDETLPSTWISDRDVYAEGTTPSTGAQVVYELAEPIVYELTDLEVIETLIDENNVWADTGPVSVKYTTKEDIL